MRRNILCLCCVVLSIDAIASEEPPANVESLCSSSAQIALDAGKFDDARSAFGISYISALEAGNQEMAAVCSFYLGLANQLEAKISASSDQRRELLLEARQWYELIPSYQRMTGVIGNLARVYSDLGMRDKGDQLLTEAAENLKGDNQLETLRSHADLLAHQGRWNEAAQQYRRVLASVPTDQATWDAYLTMLGKNLPGSLPEAVWAAVEANQTVTAQRYALPALSSAAAEPGDKIDLLAALVAALARQHYRPDTFATSEVGSGLRQLTTDPVVGLGARLVLDVHSGVDLDANSLRWWAGKNISYRRSPLESIRSLLRSLEIRTAGREIDTSRTLELADEIATEVPDLSLYIELAARYTAAGNRKALVVGLRRWETAIEKVIDQFDPTQLTYYHLAMADSLSQLSVEAETGGVDSIAYQLARAKEAAERSQNPDMLALVEESSVRLLPSPGGGGGGGGDRYARFHPGGVGCVDGPGYCENFRVEVPELLPRLEGLTAGVSRWATVVRGCEPPRMVGWRLLPSPPENSLPGRVRLARFPEFMEQGSSRKETTCLMLPPLNSVSASDCRKVELDPRPAWVTAGAWLDAESLLMVDTLRSQLLHYKINGQLLRRSTEVFAEDLRGLYPSRVRSSPSGFPVVELNLGSLLWIDMTARPIPARRTRLNHVAGAEGILEGVEDWAVVDDDTILAIGNIRHPDNSWTSGLVEVTLSSVTDFKILKQWSSNDAHGIFYRIGQPYLATMGGRGYFLEIGETLVLYEVTTTRSAQSIRRITSLPGGLDATARQKLPHLQNIANTASLYKFVEEQAVPAGLYAANGHLFLLKWTRRPEIEPANARKVIHPRP